jgi:hypothetical protein
MTVSSVVLKWETPVPARGERQVSIADQLRARPFEWAIIREYPASNHRAANNYAYRIRNGKQLEFRGPAGAYEATYRTDALAAITRLYVRYVGKS